MIIELETSLRKTDYKIIDCNNNLITSGTIENLNSVSRFEGEKMMNLLFELLDLKYKYNPEIVVFSVLGKRLRNTEKVLTLIHVTFFDCLCVEV